MRQMISGLAAAFAVVAASAAPAMACGGCAPCGYISPCVPTYVPLYAGCVTGWCGGIYERLPDPEVQYHSAPGPLPQYYYVNQGPTYTGPGNFAPYPSYYEGTVYGWYGYHHRHHYGYRHYRYSYGHRPVLHSYY